MPVFCIHIFVVLAQDEEIVQSPPPNVFAWDAFAQPSSFDSSDFFGGGNTNQDFFNESPADIPASRTQDIFAPAQVKDTEKIQMLQSEIKSLQDNTIELERQIQLMKETESNMKQQLGGLEQIKVNIEHEKSLLEDQINQLPSMDAFNSLHNVNEGLNGELQILKKKLEEWPSSEDFENMKKANDELKLKLASIGESQNEQYEQELKQLNCQIEDLQSQLSILQIKYDEERNKIPAVPEVSEVPVPSQTSDLFGSVQGEAPIPAQSQTSSLFEPVQDQNSTFTGFFDDTSLQPASSFFDSPSPIVQASPVVQADTNQELDDLKQKVEQLEKLNSELEVKLMSQTDETDKIALQTEIDQLKVALDEQKSVLEQWNTWATGKSNEIGNLVFEKEELQKSNESLTKEIQELQNKPIPETINEDAIAKLNTEKNDLEVRISENQLEIEELKSQIVKLENQIEDLQHKISNQSKIPEIVEQPVVDQGSVSSFFDNPQPSSNLLTAEEPPVEQGFSASSYFDQIAAASQPQEEEFKVEEADNSVFEAPKPTEEPEQTNETTEWYKSQLEQYQQAITDWQAWSENQMKEVTSLQESLAYYTALAEEPKGNESC